MTEKEYLYLLLHAAGTGAVTAQRLYEHFGSYEHIWKAEKRELERSGLLSHGRLSGLLEARLREEELREDFAALEKRGLRFIAWWEEGYPGRLLPFRDRPAERGVLNPNHQKSRAHRLKMAALRYCQSYLYSLLAYRPQCCNK